MNEKVSIVGTAPFKKKAPFLGVVLLFIMVSTLFCAATPVKIIGEAQVVLINSQTSAEDVYETGSLTIIVDGDTYQISCNTLGDHKGDHAGKEEVGSDGIDNYMINSSISPWNRDGKGQTGYAFSGRFPRECSQMIQAAWLGYCSKNYFGKSNTLTGLALQHGILSMSPAESVTNLVTYWPESTLPQAIKGWSRNRVFFVNDPNAYDLDQYPDGYKAWEFTASDATAIGTEGFPRRITLEGFFAKTENTNTMSGEDVRLVKKITFVAHSVELDEDHFNPLPSINVANLTIIDSRFTNTGPYIVASHADSTNGWPVRTDISSPSKGFKMAEAQARQIALDNGLIVQAKSKNARVVATSILGINLIALVVIVNLVLKAKNKKQNQV